MRHRLTARERPAANFEVLLHGFGEAAGRCIYRRELAGLHICQGAGPVAIVTATDCGQCPVPGTLEAVSCVLLRARVKLAPRLRVRWHCGATEDEVDPSSESDCGGCKLDATGQRYHLESDG